MSIFKLWIGIALVFILGALAGSLGMGMYIQHRFERFVFHDAGPGHPPPPPMMHLLIRKLDKTLELTETQRHEIENIINQTFENVHAIMQEKQPQLEKMMQKDLERIKEKLTAEQREKLERLKLFEKMKKRFHRKPPSPKDIPGEESDELLAELKERLQISEAQEQDVRSIIEENFKIRRRIAEAYRRQERSSRLAMRNEIRELQETAEKQLEKILSDEQMDIYREIQEDLRFMQEEMPPPGPHGFGEPPGKNW